MKPLSRACLIYMTTFVIGFMIISLLAFRASARFSPSTSGELYNKALHVKQNPNKYNLFFLGDSRAFCAVQPELIDPILGTQSFNLAHWTNWLPTQYPLSRDLASLLPPKATVVLFVGHINFQDTVIYDKYPITISGVPEYLNMGFPLSQIYDNIASFNPLLRFFHKRATVRTILEQTMERPLLSLQRQPPSMEQLEDSILDKDVTKRLDRTVVTAVEILRDSGKPTSIAVHKNNGGYERIEIDADFFRSKQQQNADEEKQLPPLTPDLRYVELFKKILSSFKEAGIKLIVVELEEAPHIYGTSTVRNKWRQFVRSFAQTETEAKGFPYLTLPLETIPSAGYFDYDHMNSKGITLFTPMLTKALAPHVESRQENSQ